MGGTWQEQLQCTGQRWLLLWQWWQCRQLLLQQVLFLCLRAMVINPTTDLLPNFWTHGLSITILFHFIDRNQGHIYMFTDAL